MNDDKKWFATFVETFKKLELKLSLSKALNEMPKYTKFLKDIITNKRKWTDNEMVALMETCSSIISRKIPVKLKDPGSLTIPCTLGSKEFPKCLCHLGASINLMPLSLFKELNLGDVINTNMTLQLADHSIKKPYRVVEDVLVRVDKFLFLVDFVIIDFEQDKHCPLILGRPFLNTRRAVIDVYEGKNTLRVREKKVEFVMNRLIKDIKNDDHNEEGKMVDKEIKEATLTSKKQQPILNQNPLISQVQNKVKKAKSKVNLKRKANQMIRMVYIPKNYASLKGKMKPNSINDGREEHQALINIRDEGCSSCSFT